MSRVTVFGGTGFLGRRRGAPPLRGFYRAPVMHIGDDLLDAALGPARMP